MPDDALAPLISVVIPVKNGAATLGAQLEALANQHSAPPFHIIVSDNGSQDDLSGVLANAKHRWPNLSISCVDSSDKRGAGHARNVGTNATMSSLILYCDSDDVVSANWIQALAEGLQRYDGVGGALDEHQLNSAVNSQEQCFCSSSLPVGLGFLPYPISANCGVRREVWQKLNGFDESYTLVGEEVDFYWRLQLAGYSLGFIPEAVVFYRHRTGVGANLRRAFRYGISSCQLAAHFKSRIPPESVFAILTTWVGLVLRVPLLTVGHKRLNYLCGVAHKIGQLVGSMRYGVIHLV